LVLLEAALVLVRPLDPALRAGRFFADERFADPRFFPVAILSLGRDWLTAGLRTQRFRLSPKDCRPAVVPP
jgi:hypothetical protein